MSEERAIYITSVDHERLTKLLGNPAMQSGPDKDHLLNLQRELARAVVVEPRDVPPDVVTMNSRFQVRDMRTQELIEYTLVFPHEADIGRNRLSVFAPIGMALLGYRVGDVLDWPVPAGQRTLKVEKIFYQPEAAGDFHL